MPVDLGMGVDTRVTPSLHPQNVASMDLFDSDTSGELQQVVDAFRVTYEAIASVHNAREAVKTDPTLTEAAQLIRTQDHADKSFTRAAGALDKAMANMKVGIENLERQLSAPMDTAATGRFGREIRDHVKALPADKRLGFIRAAITGGDMETAAAVLSAPAFLTSIEPDTQKAFLRQWHEQQNPLAAKRLKAMQGARDLIIKNGALLHAQLEKAVGAPPHEVRKLREAKAKADKAFAV